MKRRAQLLNRPKSVKAKSKISKGKRPLGAKSKEKKLKKPGFVKQTPKLKIEAKTTTSLGPLSARVVRIMGRGQFKVNSRVIKRLNQVDAAMVSIASKEKPDDLEFKKKLAELSEIVIRDGKPVPTKEIIKSDIILPSADLPIDEAKKLFTVQGVIPQF